MSARKLRFILNRRLPRLAWCLEVQDGAEHATITHGEWVEIGDWGFCEGAWAGDFSEGGFHKSFMTGTGVRFVADELLCVTPDHTLDRLLMIRADSRSIVSNSLPFILAVTGEELDPDFRYYDSLLASIQFGLKRFRRTLPMRSGQSLRVLYCCNLLIGNGYPPQVLNKNPSQLFSDYDEYESHLIQISQAIACNASHPSRKVKFRPLATVSRGYDSSAALVIAKSTGCQEALTFRESRGTQMGEDCGTEIARRLGIIACEYDRLAYRSRTDYPEILSNGGPTEFLSFGGSLEGTLLFTGFHGDKVWDKNCDEVSTEIVRGDASGHSLTEFRLHEGFCHLPIPFVGADRHPDLYRISNSSEMAAWSVGNSYDRPIPRRIVETAGIPRHIFGYKKHASGVVVAVEGLVGTMSEASLTDFEKFLESNWTFRKSASTRVMRLVEKLLYTNKRISKLTSRIGRKLGWSWIQVPIILPYELRVRACGHLGKEGYLAHWGLNKLIARYQVALRSVRNPEEF